MKSVSDSLPPSLSLDDPGKRFMNIGGVNHLVNGRHGGFLANANDFYVCQSLIRYGEYAEAVMNLIPQVITPGTMVVEVGASFGALTVPIARYVGKMGRVVAIEPQRILYQYLCANLALNSLPNVETYQCGCSEVSGTMAVPIIDYHVKQHTNFGGVALQKTGGEAVNVRTVDEIVGSRVVHLLKVSVNGMETKVLRGAKRTIQKSRPLLYIDNKLADKSEPLIKMLRSLDYRCYWQLPPLYNPLNYFSNGENIYGPERLIGLFCLPEGAQLDMRNFREATDPAWHPLR